MKTFFILLLFLLTSCTAGPDYLKPEPELMPKWQVTLQESKALLGSPWWEYFNDPVLNELVNASLEGNKDIKIAVANIEQFYALYGVSRAALYPELVGNSNLQFNRNEARPEKESTDTNLNLNLAWELDLWGRIRRTNEAAKADLLSKEEVKKGVVVTLVANVCKAYTELRAFDEQLKIATETLETRVGAFDLISRRFKAGAISELELRQAEAELITAKISIPEIERNISLRQNQLSLLLGKNPMPIQRGHTIGVLGNNIQIPQGLPSDVISQRPDILQAEQELISANAQIGAIKATFFPRLSLTGNGGFVSTELGNLVDANSRSLGIGPSISLPIFNAGRIAYQVDAQESRTKAALENYLRSILIAFREVEDALISIEKYGKQAFERKELVRVLSRSFKLANLAFDGGQTAYLDVLDAQRNLFNAQLQEVQTQQLRINSIIDLFRAFGEGWKYPAQTVTAQTVTPSTVAPQVVTPTTVIPTTVTP